VRCCASRCSMAAAGRCFGEGPSPADQPQHQHRRGRWQNASLLRTAVALLLLYCVGGCSASVGDRCDARRTPAKTPQSVQQPVAPPDRHSPRVTPTSTLITARLSLQIRVSACRDPAFQWCVSNCAGGDGCVMLPPAVSKHAAAECTAACPAQFDHPVPMALRLLRWSCEDDCRRAGQHGSLMLMRGCGCNATPRHSLSRTSFEHWQPQQAPLVTCGTAALQREGLSAANSDTKSLPSRPRMTQNSVRAV
jgi:hypothetical protein